ncbi:MAG: DUF2851 family protein [Flavobacteriaceae bacterium]|nr:DUF2851 family protein [Flavobacteriaceae bacterium]
MQEEFLHYIWKYKKFQLFNLTTSSNQNLEILSVGLHNLNSGPDFFNAKLKIDNQLWAGNVEIHINSSDWYLHNHEKDKNYDNVILHVVWNDNTEIFRKDNSIIPTLELKKFVLPQTLKNYNSLLLQNKQWINCEKDIADIDNFTINNWLDRLYLERLERKSKELILLQKKSKNNWEEVLFKMLSKNFGLKLNGDSFLSIAESFDFSTLRKQQINLQNLESLFFGQANLLNKEIEDSYYIKLNETYNFLKHKYKLNNQAVLPIQFFRLRPLNFPTIRLSQLATLYNKNQNLFSRIINANSVKVFYKIFNVKASNYWDTHYNFGKESKKSEKKLSKSFIDLLLINSIVPLIFTYYKSLGKSEDEKIVTLMQDLKSEKNNIVNKFQELKINCKTALESQALIELKTNYCSKNKCLQCAIGSALLNRNM